MQGRTRLELECRVQQHVPVVWRGRIPRVLGCKALLRAPIVALELILLGWGCSLWLPVPIALQESIPLEQAFRLLMDALAVWLARTQLDWECNQQQRVLAVASGRIHQVLECSLLPLVQHVALALMPQVLALLLA